MSSTYTSSGDNNLSNKFLAFLLSSVLLVLSVVYFQLDFESVVYFYFTEAVAIWICLELLFTYYFFKQSKKLDQDIISPILGLLVLSVFVALTGIIISSNLELAPDKVTALYVAAIAGVITVVIRAFGTPAGYIIVEAKKLTILRLGFMFMFAIFIPDIVSSDHGLSPYVALILFISLRIILEFILILSSKSTLSDPQTTT